MRIYHVHFAAAVILFATSTAMPATAGQYHSPDEWWFFQAMSALGGFSF